MNISYTKATAGCSIPIRPCPFCGSPAQLVLDHDHVRRGIQCSVCSACVPPLHRSEFEAMARWNRRSGGVAAAGGRATLGLRSRRKLAAAKRNLVLARRAKKIIRLKAKTDDAVARLRPYREAEGRELEELARRSRSRLEADPALSRLLNLVRPGQDYEEPGPGVSGG